MSENQIVLVGNMTRPAELRFTASGRAVASFGLAVNRRYQANGEWQEDTSFFDVVAWAQLGEHVAALDKGTRLIVVGRLSQRSWDTQDGDKRTKVEVVADELGPSLRWAQAHVEKVKRERSERTAGLDELADERGGSSGGRAQLVDEEPFLSPASMRGC